MRSLLFVPGDSEKKLAKGLGSGADALIVDLEDSVAASGKAAARETAAAFLGEMIPQEDRPRLFVRVNALDTGLTDDDLEAVVSCAPDGIMLPKSNAGADAILLDAKIAVAEAIADLPEGRIGIVPIATETAGALFTLGTYAGATNRLQGLTWGAEDLSAELGALAVRDERGVYTDPYRLARSLCLAGAVAAGVAPIDTVYVDFRNEDGLRAECTEAARDGFTAKMAIHPAQVAVINGVFTPSEQAIAEARAVMAAFAEAGDAGVTSLDGMMLDRPHIRRAERVLERARAAGIPTH